MSGVEDVNKVIVVFTLRIACRQILSDLSGTAFGRFRNENTRPHMKSKPNWRTQTNAKGTLQPEKKTHRARLKQSQNKKQNEPNVKTFFVLPSMRQTLW